MVNAGVVLNRNVEEDVAVGGMLAVRGEVQQGLAE